MPAYNITGYFNSSDPTVMNKTLSSPLFTVQGNIKISTDMIRPTFNISYHPNIDWSTCNYLYVEFFHRYYFIENKTFDTYGNVYLECVCDVLSSHKNDILNLDVIAKRSSYKFNMYQNDDEIPRLANSVVATQKFPYGFNGQTMILSVNNGGTNNIPVLGGGE